MISRGYFSHTNPDGQSPFDRMKAGGITYSYAAENIAQGYQTVFDVHSGWMNSLGHRTNILAPEYTLLGVGIVGGSGYSLTYTENFYTPR